MDGKFAGWPDGRKHLPAAVMCLKRRVTSYDLHSEKHLKREDNWSRMLPSPM